MYLLRDDGDYYFGYKISATTVIPQGDQYTVVENLDGHELAPRVITGYDENGKPVFYTPSREERKAKQAQADKSAVFEEVMKRVLSSFESAKTGKNYPQKLAATIGVLEGNDSLDVDELYQQVLETLQ